MSMLDIFVDDEMYGCAVLLNTAIPPDYIWQWYQSTSDKLLSVLKVNIKQSSFPNLCAQKWYTIRFEFLHLSEWNINTANDVYEMFFKGTVMDDWLNYTDRQTQKRLRKMGSLSSDHGLITTDELIALFELNKSFIEEQRRHNECENEFRTLIEKNNGEFIGWSSLQKLSDKYQYAGGRWIFMPRYSGKKIEETINNRNWIASQLFHSFLCGEFAKCGFVTAIIYRNCSRHNQLLDQCTFSILNANSVFNGCHLKEQLVCIKNDPQAHQILTMLIGSGVAELNRIIYLRYKTNICSVCHWTRPKGKFDPHIYVADLGADSQRKKPRECRCRQSHYIDDIQM